MNIARELYLDLMKKILTNWIYGSKEVKIYQPNDQGRLDPIPKVEGAATIERK